MHPLVQLVIVGPFVWFCTQLLALSLFRQNILNSSRELLYTTIVISIISFLIQFVKLPILVTSVTPAMFILCFRLIYKFQWKQAVIIIAATYPIISMIEVLVHFIYSKLTDNHILEKLAINDDFSLIIYCVIIYLLLITILQSFRLGFTFINKNDYKKSSDPYMNTVFYLSILCLIALGFAGAAMYVYFNPQILFYTVTPIILLLVVLLELHFRKELKES